MTQITINKRHYTIISRSQPYSVNLKTERLILEDSKGNQRTAQFYNGEFELWEDRGSSKPSSAYGPNRKTISRKW